MIKITKSDFDKGGNNDYAFNKNDKMKDNKNKMNKPNKFTALALAALLLAGNILLASAPVSAAAMTQTTLRLNRMAAGQSTSFRLVFRTSSSVSGATSVVIAMNGADSTTWTTTGIGAVNATQTVSSASCVADVGGSALPGSITAAGNAGTGVITISAVTALAASTQYCVDLTSATALTLPSAGEYHPTVTAGTDNTTIAVRTITNDQITVTAVVPPSFNFTLSGNSDAFTANLGTGAVGTTTGVTATVNTNAKTGWIAWAKDSSTGLNSAATGKTIASTTPGTSATLSAGTEGFTMGVTNITQGSGLGVTSVPAAYDATASAHGSGLDSTLRQIASSTGTASSASITLKERAAISALTPAANDYTDTITVIGAGSF